MWVVVAAECGGEGNQHYAPERREQHDADHRQRTGTCQSSDGLNPLNL
ncbi:hypothetical protein J3A72_000773 [Stenotrophomonas sp. PvP093]|nr:hypothetical protein [Stenotrophomonas sp. PvP093]VEF35144.1 Uncharacterised protein [Stenotrophomonas maltophilia]